MFRIDADDDKRKNFDIKELRHNLDLALDMEAQNFRRINALQQSLTDQNTAIEYGLPKMKADEDDEIKIHKKMEGAYEFLKT